ncbi:MAG: hypothetical protein KJ011_01780 [Burkholderiaceae bacterium]|nr:hypothetical protein [Burkholderiaceae bacterium]
MGRGKSKRSLELIDAAVRILEEIQPASVRAVCYRLFVEGFIASMAVKNTKRVSEQLVWARENDVIPWERIVDETRQAERVRAWDNPDQIIRAAVNGYRRDYWQDQPERVEVWSEKGTIRGTLAPVLDKFGVTFRVMHGFSSATAMNGIAEETRANHKPLTVLYLGDWDPSGLHMSERDIPSRLDRYDGEATVRRIALRVDDVATGTRLPSFDAESKTGDSRHRWFVENYGHRCWELDSLSPVTLRERVQAEIIRRLDVAAWGHAIDIEQAETDSMREFLLSWQRGKSGPDTKYPAGAA